MSTSLSTWHIIQYALIGAIALSAIRHGYILFKLNLHASAFAAAITKLLRAGNVERAMKLCGAAPGNHLARCTSEMLMRYQEGWKERSLLRDIWKPHRAALKAILGKLRLLSIIAVPGALGAIAVAWFQLKLISHTWLIMGGIVLVITIAAERKGLSMLNRYERAVDNILATIEQQEYNK